jgi:hypothetical protein
MINVFEALKSEGLVYQDPSDPSGSTWLISDDADKVVEKVEKLVDYAWKTGRRYQLGELRTNRRIKKKKITIWRQKPYGEGDVFCCEDGCERCANKQGEENGYNQAVDDFEKLFEDEEAGIYEKN